MLRYKDLSAKDPYFRQWTEYRKRNRIVIFLFVSFVPAMFLIAVPLGYLVGENKAAFTVFLIWAGLLLIFGNYAALWHCPRCGKPFQMDFGRYVNPLTRTCVHCKLDRWSPDGKKCASK